MNIAVQAGFGVDLLGVIMEFLNNNIAFKDNFCEYQTIKGRFVMVDGLSPS